MTVFIGWPNEGIDYWNGSTVTAGELRFFVVCAVQQVPT